MAGKDIKIRSSNGGGEFDCYLAIPVGETKVHAVDRRGEHDRGSFRAAGGKAEVAVELSSAVA